MYLTTGNRPKHAVFEEQQFSYYFVMLQVLVQALIFVYVGGLMSKVLR